MGKVMIRPLRTAVVGAGFVAPFHVDAVRRGGYAEVAVLVGNRAARVEEKARALGVPHWTTDIAAVIGDASLDVIHVCTPNATHVELGLAALGSGHHVVLEKPLALDGEGASRLLVAARAAGRHAAVVFTYRGYPMVRRARELVAAGELGDLRLAHGGYLQDWLLEATDWNWRIDPAQGRSRAVADIGSHWFDTLEFVSGRRVEAVFADLATFLMARDRPAEAVDAFASAGGPAERVAVVSEDAATLAFRLSGGMRATCLVSQVNPGRKNAFTLELAGSLRSLAWAQEDPERLWLGARHEPLRVIVREPADGMVGPGVPPLPAGHPEGWAEALRDVLRPFYRAIASDERPPGDPSERADYPTFADGARAVAFVDAVLESNRTGTWAPIAPLRPTA